MSLKHLGPDKKNKKRQKNSNLENSGKEETTKKMSLITKAGTIVCLCGAKALMEDDVHDVQYIMLDIITCRCAFRFPQNKTSCIKQSQRYSMQVCEVKIILSILINECRGRADTRPFMPVSLTWDDALQGENI